VLVIVLAVAAVVGVVAWFVFNRKHPENAAGHPAPAREGSALYYGDTNDRPGSPGAEADGVADRGSPVPGPSAETTQSTDGPRH
jgi:hypothetical protein